MTIGKHHVLEGKRIDFKIPMALICAASNDNQQEESSKTNTSLDDPINSKKVIEAHQDQSLVLERQKINVVSLVHYKLLFSLRPEVKLSSQYNMMGKSV